MQEGVAAEEMKEKMIRTRIKSKTVRDRKGDL